MVVGLEKFTGVFDELVMVSRFLIANPCDPVLIAHAPDREHTGERPSHAVPRPAAGEIRSRETSKITNTPREVGQVRHYTFGPTFEGTRGKEEKRGRDAW